MTTAHIAISITFVLGYLAIATEHNINIDKTASAILTGVLCWTLYIANAQGLVDVSALPAWFMDQMGGKSTEEVLHHWIGQHQILESLGEISSILFFLLGAMTIVELVDAYGGFTIITRRISSHSTVTLLWIIGLIAFFMSAALDNLTTTIVMISLVRKLVSDNHERWFFASIIVVAANAGGAWSPIGDVTTTMLWIGGQITTVAIIKGVFLPSLAVLVVPLIYLSWRLKGHTVTAPAAKDHSEEPNVTPVQRNIIFTVGILGLLFVPIFKTLTHLPPFMGMMFSLSILWVISELINKDRDQAMDSGLHILKVLRRIDTPSVMFFLGILLAVSALQATGILGMLADSLNHNVGDIRIIVFLIGLLSAVVDNVPLVAATMGMYDLATHPVDSLMWEFLAFAAGTGGSCLIIGSAAGVAAMGMERINFFWYVKHISGLALMGYISGALIYLATVH